MNRIDKRIGFVPRVSMTKTTGKSQHPFTIDFKWPISCGPQLEIDDLDIDASFIDKASHLICDMRCHRYVPALVWMLFSVPIKRNFPLHQIELNAHCFSICIPMPPALECLIPSVFTNISKRRVAVIGGASVSMKCSIPRIIRCDAHHDPAVSDRSDFQIPSTNHVAR